MFKNKKTVLIIALLAGISIFSAYKYVITLREKYALTNEIGRIKQQIDNLEKEKQNLLQTLEKEKTWQEKLRQESLLLKENLRMNHSRLAKIHQDLAASQKNVEQLNIQVSALQAEAAVMKTENEKLKTDFSVLSKENEDFKARFNSIPGLKEAIRNLKRHGSQPLKPAEGNQGFVVKDGKTTFPTKVIIEVNPAANK